MDTFLRIDINLVAVILLGVVILIAFRRLDENDQLNRVFLISCVIVILELIFESATCILNRRPEPWAAPVSTVLHICLFGTGPILTYFWYRMICYWIIPTEKITRKRNLILTIPIVLNLVITLLSPIYRLVFYIDHSNVYHRGPLFLLSMSIVYFYFIYTIFLIYRQRETVVKEEYVPLLLFGVLPLIGGVLQAVCYGVLLMWSCVGFSLVVAFIFLQQRMVHIDDLTGAWTRGAFEYNLEKRTKQHKKDAFGLLALDIDGLKRINDEYGHIEGDYALKTAVKLVKSVLRKTDIIARTGGDEFLIILDCKSKAKMEYTIEKIKTTFVEHNETANKGYLLDCSIGAELFDTEYKDINQFMQHVDSLMYKNKNIKKCS